MKGPLDPAELSFDLGVGGTRGKRPVRPCSLWQTGLYSLLPNLHGLLLLRVKKVHVQNFKNSDGTQGYKVVSSLPPLTPLSPPEAATVPDPALCLQARG